MLIYLDSKREYNQVAMLQHCRGGQTLLGAIDRAVGECRTKLNVIVRDVDIAFSLGRLSVLGDLGAILRGDKPRMNYPYSGGR